MMDKDYLYQIDIREWIERGLDADIMVPVSGNKIDKKYDIYLQSFLLPLNEVENDMENDTYNAHTLMPGITVYGSWEDDEKVYHRWGNDNGYEPLVIKREYNGVATDSIEIVEEFRLLFNLYFNSQKNEYIDVSNGEGITVVKMNDKASPVLNVLDTNQNKRYIMYYLRSMAYSDVFLALATGIRVRSCDLRWNKLADLSYPVPPLDEQKAIVEHVDAVLAKADDVISDKKEQLATLDEYKKSLIFEYVTGKKEVV